MYNTFNEDRKFIEGKYHNPNEEFNPYQRMKYHGYAFDTSTGLEDDEILKGLSEIREKLSNYPHPVAKALAVKYVTENTKIDINEHDYFVGIWSLNRLANSVTSDVWYKEVFENILSKTHQEMNDYNESWAISIWPDFDHVVPDWDSIMELGFTGIVERALKYKDMHTKNGTLTPEKEAFFDGIIIEYNALISLIERLYKNSLTKSHGKAEKIATCLKHLCEGAPQNIYEAMQAMYIYFIVSECFDSFQVRSLGNGLDYTFYRFYKNDLKNGTFTKDEIRELLSYFLIQWSAIGNYWGQPFYLGGTNIDGTTRFNELSYEILDVYEELDIYNPKIQIKVNENTPDKILFKVFNMIRKGKTCFVFVCEPGIIKAVMNYGATYEEALNMDIRGCYETGVRGNEVTTGSGYINNLKAIEYVFTNGFDERVNKQMGLKTGELSSFKCFDDFYNAVIKQWGYLIEKVIKMSSDFEKYLGYINPSNLYSGTIAGAMEKGVDAYQSGVKFNNSSILSCGFGSFVDAIMAVKEFVYDKKLVSLQTFSDALDANWEGYEDLHTLILKSTHKYGNDDYETDKYTEALSSYFTSSVSNRPNARGGVYKANMHSAMQFVWQGEKTKASPDGRYAGAEISKNASPSVGMDKNGVTALINSAIKTRPYTYSESHCLDVMLHPSAISGDEGLNVMKSLLFMYLKNDGQSMQFNVFDSEVLKDAQKNPDKYKNLQVRVCGWNVLWNNLSEKEQNAYILRAENTI